MHISVAAGNGLTIDNSTGAFLQQISPTGHVSIRVAGYGSGLILWKEAIAIDTNAKVGIGITNPTMKLSVNGNANKATGGEHWATWSDERLKTNIEPIEDALARVCDLEGVRFEWKDKDRFEEGRHMGMVAQDVEKVIPEWVFEDPDGYKMLQSEGFQGLIVEAIKEQQEIIRQLQEKVRELEERLRE
jgi:hypothetical protein